MVGVIAMSDVFVPDLHVESRSRAIEGVRFAICGGGGIAAVELPRIARELRRHGGHVRFVVTENCLRFVGRDALEWASENPVVVNLSGLAEHICQDDAVLVVPATADLLGKMARGLCPDGATTLVQSALGRGVPILICPTMHETLAASPLVEANRVALSGLSHVRFLTPRIEEGKEKVPSPEDLVLEVCHLVQAHRLYRNGSQPRILVSYGGTRVPLDSVRYLGNFSTGGLGRTLILDAYRRGIRVTGLQGNVVDPIACRQGLHIASHRDFDDFAGFLRNVDSADFDGFFAVAAVSDFAPEKKQPGKIESANGSLNLRMGPTPKLLSLPNLANIPYRAGCKLTATDAAEGIPVAQRLAAESVLHAVLWNQSSTFSSASHAGILLLQDSCGGWLQKPVEGKEAIASAFLAHFLAKFLLRGV